jgi:hypothetical protein
LASLQDNRLNHSLANTGWQVKQFSINISHEELSKWVLKIIYN